jgi:hypothetical protein
MAPAFLAMKKSIFIAGQNRISVHEDKRGKKLRINWQCPVDRYLWPELFYFDRTIFFALIQ